MKVRDRSDNALEQQEKTANRLRMQGFFSFKDGKIEGPVELKQAFKKSTEFEQQTPAPSQIHLKKEIDPDAMVIKRKVAEYEVETHQAIFEFKSSVESSIERLVRLGAVVEPDLAQKAALPEQNKSNNHLNQNASQDFEKTKNQIVVNKKPILFEDLPQVRLDLEDFPSDFIVRTKNTAKAHTELDVSYNEPSAEVAPQEKVVFAPIKLNPQIVAPSYLTLRGRLRLGVLRTFGLGSIIKFFLTLGCNILLWYSDAQNEVAWHKSAQWRKLSWHQILFGLLPPLSVFNFMSLARQIRILERQNGYEKTTVYLVFFLALFPPLAAMYLQSSLNRHWRLHVQNFNE
ncbi:MAG: hypothetical protein KBD78_02260 [Oligoflexales bacterium]|nr:hypothetical protein [Oligoflexales bacterium]